MVVLIATASYGSPPPPSGPVNDWGKYDANASPGFDSAHFSVWGRAAATDQYLIQDMVTNHQADLLLVMLGFNDLGWFYSDQDGLLNSMHTFVTNARAANPNLKFAIASEYCACPSAGVDRC